MVSCSARSSTAEEQYISRQDTLKHVQRCYLLGLSMHFIGKSNGATFPVKQVSQMERDTAELQGQQAAVQEASQTSRTDADRAVADALLRLSQAEAAQEAAQTICMAAQNEVSTCSLHFIVSSFGAYQLEEVSMSVVLPCQQQVMWPLQEIMHIGI